MKRYFYITGKNGMDLICNICGHIEFLKRLEGIDYIARRIKPERYEEPSPGWIVGRDGNDICPGCNKDYVKEDQS